MRTIAASAPGRVSFAGGGTDLPEYADRFGGAVVSCTLDRFAAVRITPRVDALELVSLDAGSREVVPAASHRKRMRVPILAEEHVLFPKAAAALHRIERGRIEVTGGVPIGAGLASSGSLSVALCAAVRAFVGEQADPAAIAEDAFRLEAELLARPVGRQDHVASAHGGLNLIEFERASFRVTPLRADVRALGERIVLLSNGARRDAAIPLADQRARTIADDPATLAHLDWLTEAAHTMRALLEAGDLDSAGDLLDRTWHRKRELSARMTSVAIDDAYALARASGALGAKLCGAGQAGALLAWCENGRAEEVRQSLATLGWFELPFNLSMQGVRCDVISVGEEAGG